MLVLNFIRNKFNKDNQNCTDKFYKEKFADKTEDENKSVSFTISDVKVFSISKVL